MVVLCFFPLHGVAPKYSFLPHFFYVHRKHIPVQRCNHMLCKFLSLYLLMALGLKGGFALASSGLSDSVMMSLFAALLMASIVPALGYAFLKSRMSKFDAAAVAASYGSVSAVTFVTAMQYLESQQLTVGGHMAVAMVLMESPAIIMAVLMANVLRQTASQTVIVAGVSAGGAVLSSTPETGRFPSIVKILHESFTNGAHLMLLASLLIGYASGETGKAMMSPFSMDLFKGMLAFFLLDMGLMVAKNLLILIYQQKLFRLMPLEKIKAIVKTTIMTITHDDFSL